MNASQFQYRSLATLIFAVTLNLVLFSSAICQSKARKLSGGSAIVVDERLAVLRTAPHFSAPLLRRLGRGRIVTILNSRVARDGVVFYRVAVTRRTRGWIQNEALIVPQRRGADARLLRLINASRDFDRIARARIFLDIFPRSSLRPAVLLMFGDEADRAAQKLSRDAARRLDGEDLHATGAALASYFLNYSGLDRYRRQGIVFEFDERTRQFRYEGSAWRELVRRYQNTAEAAAVRQKR